jgi:hypothetical protein
MKYTLQAQYEINGEWWDIWQSETADTVLRITKEITSNDDAFQEVLRAYRLRVIEK